MVTLTVIAFSQLPQLVVDVSGLFVLGQHSSLNHNIKFKFSSHFQLKPRWNQNITKLLHTMWLYWLSTNLRLYQLLRRFTFLCHFPILFLVLRFDPLVGGGTPPFWGALTKIVRQIEGGTRKRGHMSPLLPTEPLTWIAVN